MSRSSTLLSLGAALAVLAAALWVLRPGTRPPPAQQEAQPAPVLPSVPGAALPAVSEAGVALDEVRSALAGQRPPPGSVLWIVAAPGRPAVDLLEAARDVEAAGAKAGLLVDAGGDDGSPGRTGLRLEVGSPFGGRHVALDGKTVRGRGGASVDLGGRAAGRGPTVLHVGEGTTVVELARALVRGGEGVVVSELPVPGELAPEDRFELSEQARRALGLPAEEAKEEDEAGARP